MSLPWKSVGVLPTHGQLCLLVINHQIIPDICVWNDKDRKWHNNGFTHPPSEVQAWLNKGDIPYPEFLAEEMCVRDELGAETVLAAARYRESNGDMFGYVKDPDDDKIIDEQMDAL